jgi:PKD repeat protein
MSTGHVTEWAWDLNWDDAVDSFLRNPDYCYTLNGYYTITLTVTCDSGCTSTMTKQDYIYVTGCGG